MPATPAPAPEAPTGPTADPLLVPEAAPPPADPAPAPGATPPAADPEAAPDSSLPGGGALVRRDLASRLPEGTRSVRVNRAGSDTPAAPAQPNAAPADPGTGIGTGSALERFSVAAENPDNKPVIGVILLDDGALPPSALAVLGYPVTVVIDASLPDAAERLASYRAAGREVGVTVALPAGAQPSDVEVTLGAVFGTLPETILLLDDGSAGLQSDRAVTEQAMAVLADGGRGLVTIARGLNTALRAADAAGVPSAVIYRDLDSEGQDARVIGRFLDQAAFRARQDSGVVLLGRIRRDTIEALQGWGGASRASQVAVVPVSSVLRP